MTTPVAFIKETIDELKKVTWPKQQEVIRLTVTVLLISLIVGLYIGTLDFTFTNILQMLVK